MIYKVRSKIENNACGQTNCYGFLTGAVGEYLDEFDSQISKINARLEQDKRYWDKYASKHSKKKD